VSRGLSSVLSRRRQTHRRTAQSANLLAAARSADPLTPEIQMESFCLHPHFRTLALATLFFAIAFAIPPRSASNTEGTHRVLPSTPTPLLRARGLFYGCLVANRQDGAGSGIQNDCNNSLLISRVTCLQLSQTFGAVDAMFPPANTPTAGLLESRSADSGRRCAAAREALQWDFSASRPTSGFETVPVTVDQTQRCPGNLQSPFQAFSMA